MELLFVKDHDAKMKHRESKFRADEEKKRITYWRGLLMDVCQWLLIMLAEKKGKTKSEEKVKVTLMFSDIFRLWKDFPNGIWKLFLRSFRAMGSFPGSKFEHIVFVLGWKMDVVMIFLH